LPNWLNVAIGLLISVLQAPHFTSIFFVSIIVHLLFVVLSFLIN
jgi:hypothetical protein